MEKHFNYVDDKTEVLTVDGFKTMFDVRTEERLVVVDSDMKVTVKKVETIATKMWCGRVHKYYGEDGYNVCVCPDSRLIVSESDEVKVVLSSKIIGDERCFGFPTCFGKEDDKSKDVGDVRNISKANFLKMTIPDEIFEKDDIEKVAFLREWSNMTKLTSSHGWVLRAETQEIKDKLQILAISIGCTSFSRDNVVIVRRKKNANYTFSSTASYNNKIAWCPYIQSGFNIYRRNGSVFIN